MSYKTEIENRISYLNGVVNAMEAGGFENWAELFHNPLREIEKMVANDMVSVDAIIDEMIAPHSEQLYSTVMVDALGITQSDVDGYNRERRTNYRLKGNEE